MSQGFPFPPNMPIVDSKGVPTQYFYNWLTGYSTYSGTIVTAKLTPGGTNGSMSFLNGKLIKEVAAT